MTANMMISPDKVPKKRKLKNKKDKKKKRLKRKEN